MSTHYDIVLGDLEAKKADFEQMLQEAQQAAQVASQHIQETEKAIEALRRLHPVKEQGPQPRDEPKGDCLYAGISMRWAILCMLCEHVHEPIGRVEIARRLGEGGASFQASNLLSSVSAVLSQMAAKREVRQTEGKTWTITPTGIQAWKAIKESDAYKSRQRKAA